MREKSMTGPRAPHQSHKLIISRPRCISHTQGA
nr:MAG TPA: hypothetical protein [Siphoviridae sp. ct6662]DAO71188.1 MAG TPA: hypothetical protein [Caudoviricetes sp.]